MNRLIKAQLFLLLPLLSTAALGQTKVNVDYYTTQNKFCGNPFHPDGQIYVNFYLAGPTQPAVNTTALLPAWYFDEYSDKCKFDSINFPDDECIGNLRDGIKSKLVKGYVGKYTKSQAVDSALFFDKWVNSYSTQIRGDQIQGKLINSPNINKKGSIKRLLDSLEKAYNDPELSVISPAVIDSYIDNSNLYRVNAIKHKYEPWGGLEHYKSICDSLTDIVQSELASRGLFKLVSPPEAKDKCDSVYNSLNDEGQYLWYFRFYPNTMGDSCYFPNGKIFRYVRDDKAENRLSNDILRALGAETYVVIRFYGGNLSHIQLEPKPGISIIQQIYLKISIIGPDFNALWSADLPISKQIKWKSGLPFEKDERISHPYTIIDYKMAREGVKQALSLLKSNNAGDKFR